MYLSVVTVMF